MGEALRHLEARERSWSTRSRAPASSGSRSHSSIQTPSTASSRRWFPLTSANDFVRIEIGLDGGQILSTLVTPKSADALEQSLQAGAAGSLALEAQEGTIMLVLPRVLYAKRFARESRVGFGG